MAQAIEKVGVLSADQYLEVKEQASTPSTPGTGYAKLYRKTDGQFYVLGEDGIESPIGSGGSIKQVTQAGHGYVAADVGAPVYLSSGVYTLAQGNAANTAEVVGLLSRVIDTNTFEVTLSGEVTGLVADVFESDALPTVDALLYLSTAEAGKLTVTAPTAVGQIEKPLGYVSRVGGGDCDIVFVNMRANVVGGVNAIITRTLSNNASTTIKDFSDMDAGRVTGFVFVDATTDLRAYYDITFTKNGAGDYQATTLVTGTDDPADFSMSDAGVLSCTLPDNAGFVSARFDYQIQAPGVGASLPTTYELDELATDAISVKTPSGSQSFKNSSGVETGSYSDGGGWDFGTAATSGAALVDHSFSGYRLRLQTNDSDAVGSAGLGYFQFLDGAGTQMGIIGYASSANTDLDILNSLGGSIDFWTNGVLVGSVSASGEWSFGQSSGTSRHTSNGPLSVNFGTSSPTLTNSSVNIRVAGSTLPSIGSEAVGTGSSRKHFTFYHNSGSTVSTSDEVGFISTTPTATTYDTSSDMRLKEDFQGFSGLSILSGVSFYDFKWKKNDERAYGVVAQELYQVFPLGVTKPEDEDSMWGVDYSKLVPILGKAIQEQQAIIESLQARIEALENK